MNKFISLKQQVYLWIIALAINCYSENNLIHAEVNRIVIHPTWGNFSRPLNRITFADFWFNNGCPTKNITNKTEMQNLIQMLDNLQCIGTLDYNVMDGALKARADTTATIEWITLSRPKAQIIIYDNEKEPELIWLTDNTVQRGNQEYILTDELRKYISDRTNVVYKSHPDNTKQTQWIDYHIGAIKDIDFETNDTVIVLRSIVGTDVTWVVGAKRYDFINYCLQAQNPYQILSHKEDVRKFMNALTNAEFITELPYDVKSPAVRAKFIGNNGLVLYMQKDSPIGLALIYTKQKCNPEIIWLFPTNIQRGHHSLKMTDYFYNLLLETGLHNRNSTI